MVHTDLVQSKVEFIYEGVFDLKEMLSVIKDYLKNYDYDLSEKVYDIKTKNGLKTLNLKWSISKKLDDYNKAIIDFRIELSDYKESNVDGAKVVDGKLNIGALILMNRDYDEKWKKAPTKKVIRALYDKFVVASKNKKVDDAVKDMVNGLMKEIRDYFKA